MSGARDRRYLGEKDGSSSWPHLDQRGHGVHFVEVLCDAFHQVSHRHADGPGSVALQLDDLVGPAVHKHTLMEVFLLEPERKLSTISAVLHV